MSYPPAPETDFSPTAQLPRVGRRRHLDSGGPSRLIWILVAAAVVMTVAAVIAVLKVGDDTRPLAAPPVASDAPLPEEPEPTFTEAAPLLPSLPAPSSSAPRPSATPAARPQPRPAEIIAALRGTVRALVADGQLNRSAGEQLDDRLRTIGALLADGKLQRARRQLNDLARNVIALHEGGKLSDQGFQALTAGISLLQQSLTAR